MRFGLVGVLACLVLLGTSASAASKGDSYLSLTNKVTAKKDVVTRDKQYQLRVDRYVMDDMAVGVVVNIKDDVSVLSGGVVLNEDLEPLDATKETVPYVGLGVGARREDDVKYIKIIDVKPTLGGPQTGLDWAKLVDTRTVFEYGGQVGVRHEFSDTVGVFTEVSFRTTDKLDNGTTSVFVGLRLKA